MQCLGLAVLQKVGDKRFRFRDELPQERFEEELAQDVLEIITVFSARPYGSRSHKNKKLVEALEGVVSA